MTAVEELTREDVCSKCGGLGTISVYHGPVGGTVECPVCGGDSDE